MKDKTKIIIAIITTVVAMSTGYIIYLLIPQHTEYYVKNEDGTRTQIAVVSENRRNGEKNIYLSYDGETYRNQSDSAIDWSINLSADYVYGKDVHVSNHKLSFLEKPELEKINQ